MFLHLFGNRCTINVLIMMMMMTTRENMLEFSSTVLPTLCTMQTLTKVYLLN